ncbi:type II toxin-antitoxin system VapC family toxin [Acidobacteria bacterium ACD]|nr:MAG: PIN domain-containing protein [Acidobacteriota bacterium]MCE7956524.1 PIN domain-containing protein [Acidobacteria bacterium ACB2]MDL1951664.1 type II toxin-antitoxin system VapC family toxin [Acidobacteria bacterium ACD]
MAALTHLDTHVVAWLYAGRAELLSARARRAIEEGDLVVSPVVVLELQYLFETRRTAEPATVVLEDLSSRIGLAVSPSPFPAVTRKALELSWTRDPFDRLLVAQAALDRARLVTKDRAIRSRYPAAVW